MGKRFVGVAVWARRWSSPPKGGVRVQPFAITRLSTSRLVEQPGELSLPSTTMMAPTFVVGHCDGRRTDGGISKAGNDGLTFHDLTQGSVGHRSPLWRGLMADALKA